VFVSLRLDSCGPQLGTKFWVMRDGKVACVKWMKHRVRVKRIGGKGEGGRGEDTVSNFRWCSLCFVRQRSSVSAAP
jgi:hypothetical protein